MDALKPALSPSFSIDRFKKLYQPFSEASLAQLDEVYGPDIVFKDPVHQLQGLKELYNYFRGFCAADVHCEFEFINQILNSHQAFFQWRMHYSHPKIKGGLPLTLNGATLIKFNDRITYHEDFYDMGAMIYQHMPVLGFLVKKINARIAGTSTSTSTGTAA